MADAPLDRAAAFCSDYELDLPILMAPMAGACPVELALAVSRAGGMGACGTLVMSPDEIAEWVRRMRAGSNGAFQLNTWIPGPDPIRDPEVEARVRDFLAQWGPEVPPDAGDAPSHDFDAACSAMLAAGPRVISSIMGLYPPDFVAEMKARNIAWFATVTTVGEARAAAAAGADVLVAQGAEAGGHRGAFDAANAETAAVGLFSLLPAVVDSTDLPVVATGGIADHRGVAAALLLGASAVQIGTALLRSPEAAIPKPWADGIAAAAPEDTMLTRAFSGRAGRSLRTAYAQAAAAPGAPEPAPYPVQRGLTGPMRSAAAQDDTLDRIQAWAGQSARLAPARPAADFVRDLWDGARALLA